MKLAEYPTNELWTDEGICLVRWYNKHSFDAQFLSDLWKGFGGLSIYGVATLVNEWVEFRIDGEAQWREEVPEKALKQRKEVADERQEQNCG